MLDLFDQNGHLTDEALQALIREEDLDGAATAGNFRASFFLRCMHSPLHGIFYATMFCSRRLYRCTARL